jgi:glycosyltransferase involved in cell wall biosynthesis
MCLLFVGTEGPETRRLKDLVNKNSLQRRVYLETSITDPELCWLYTNCTLFLAPSVTEGFGMPVIEALQCNCRIVCSDIPVFREIAGAACHYVDLRGDSPVHALADAANSARHDQPRKAEMLNRFSEQEIAAQYVALYSKLLAAVPECSTTAPASLSRTIPYDRYAS